MHIALKIDQKNYNRPTVYTKIDRKIQGFRTVPLFSLAKKTVKFMA